MCEFDVCNGNTEESYTTPGGDSAIKMTGVLVVPFRVL